MREDYYKYGFTDFDIEYWRQDQLGAPEPPMAGWVIWDMADGDLDGEIDIYMRGKGYNYYPREKVFYECEYLAFLSVM